MSEEIWVPVAGCSRYEVSSRGEIRSWISRSRLKKRSTHPIYLTQYKSEDGKMHINLVNDQGKQKGFTVGALVLESFGFEKPPGTFVRYKDDDPTNCAIDNLYWGKHGKSRWDGDEVIKILLDKRKVPLIARELGVRCEQVRRVKKAHVYKHHYRAYERLVAGGTVARAA